MLNTSLILAALLLFSLPHAASAESTANKYIPGTPYYFSDFDPAQRPWQPGQHLNIEEVFKNYQYFEIVFDQGGKGITVYRYLRGNREVGEKYLLLPDNSLQRK